MFADVKVWGFGAANLPANCTSPFFNVTLNGVVVSGMQISLSASAFSVTGELCQSFAALSCDCFWVAHARLCSPQGCLRRSP